MGMTLWIHTLEDRNYAKDSDDHSLMHGFSEALDALCEDAGKPRLTDFFDFTGLEYDFGDDDEDEPNPDLDPDTELGYGIDDMSWFRAADGLATLTMLHDRLNAGAPLEGLSADQRDGLLEELADCIAILQGPASRGGKFHLSVVA